jgi:hypothetical protein
MAIYSDYIAAAIMYNLQILPELVMTGLILLAIVLANPTLVVLAASTGATQLLTGAVGQLIMKFAPDEAVVSSSLDSCHKGFVGKTWDRLLRGTASPDLLWHPKAPSVYLSTMGFLAGWGWALQALYKEEIDHKVLSRSTMTSVGVITALLLILFVGFRILSGCETWIGAAGGVFFGLVLGYLAAVAIGYASNRRLTNIWGIPLLRDRINDGSAVYVCP